MGSVLRGATTYFFVWLIFRIAGKRTLAQITTFDAMLLLIISECVQGALVGNDNSMTNSFLLILTLVGIDIFLSCLKQKFPIASRILDGGPVVLLDPQGLRQESMRRERIDLEDILAAARQRHGIIDSSGIQYAIVEESGVISIIPRKA